MDLTKPATGAAYSASSDQPASSSQSDPLAPRRRHRRKRIDDQAKRNRHNERLAHHLRLIWVGAALLALIVTLFPALLRDPTHEVDALLKTAGVEAGLILAFLVIYRILRVPPVKPGEEDDCREI